MIHGSFTIALQLSASPSEVFAAYAELPRRQRWFRLPATSGVGEHELDFRVGGSEFASATFATATLRERLVYRSHFLDIVPARRIVLVYEFLLDERRRWVSLVTLDFSPDGDRTRFRHTEQYAFVAPNGDGRADVAHLEGGTRMLLNGLAAVLEP